MTIQSETPVAYAVPVTTVDHNIPVTQATSVPIATTAIPVATANTFPEKNQGFQNASVVGVQQHSTGPKLNYGADGKVQSGRFFCAKCQEPYDLPVGATTWRCPNCHHFNNTTGDECPCCVVS